MNKLKTKFGKYFQFKNTTNGTDYFLRGLALILFIIPIGIFVGVGVALITTNTVLAGLLVGIGGFGIIPMIWFSLATTYKRINAFFPNNAGWLLAPTLPNGDYITYLVLAIPSLIWSLYLLFGNSKVEKHIG